VHFNYTIIIAFFLCGCYSPTLSNKIILETTLFLVDKVTDIKAYNPNDDIVHESVMKCDSLDHNKHSVEDGIYESKDC